MISKNNISSIQEVFSKLKTSMGTLLAGMEDIMDMLIVAFFADGHVLLEGVPGLGKTLLAKSFSRVIGCDFGRIQFTPDLMPADVLGTTIYNQEKNSFQIKKGPVFTSVLLADEINRAPAKTQASLLQVMQEKKINIDTKMFDLGRHFFCIATQNPIEMEGTYPLPEAQIDRFMMKILITYPDAGAEKEILLKYREGVLNSVNEVELKAVMKVKNIDEFKDIISQVKVEDPIIDYIGSIVRATRDYPGIEIGASPRAAVSLFQGSKVLALIEGRDFVIPDDIKYLAPAVLRHRVILKPESEIEGYSTDFYIQKILETVEVPR